MTLTSAETRFAFRAAATVGGGSAGFDLVYDPTGRIGQATLTATANRVPLAISRVARPRSRAARRRGRHRPSLARRRPHDARRAQFGQRLDRLRGRQGLWPRDRLANWPPETQRLLGGGDCGVPFNCIAGRFDVSGGVASLRRLVVDTPRVDHGGRRLPPSCAPRDGNSSSRPRRATARTLPLPRRCA